MNFSFSVNICFISLRKYFFAFILFSTSSILLFGAACRKFSQSEIDALKIEDEVGI